LNRRSRFCRQGRFVYLVDSSCFLVGPTPPFSLVFGRYCSQVVPTYGSSLFVDFGQNECRSVQGRVPVLITPTSHIPSSLSTLSQSKSEEWRWLKSRARNTLFFEFAWAAAYARLQRPSPGTPASIAERLTTTTSRLRALAKPHRGTSSNRVGRNRLMDVMCPLIHHFECDSQDQHCSRSHNQTVNLFRRYRVCRSHKGEREAPDHRST
jgi:hypothetical protein